MDDVEQELGSFSHRVSAQPITNIYEDISVDKAGEIENSDGKKELVIISDDPSTPNITKSDHDNSNVIRVASDNGGE